MYEYRDRGTSSPGRAVRMNVAVDTDVLDARLRGLSRRLHRVAAKKPVSIKAVLKLLENPS